MMASDDFDRREEEFTEDSWLYLSGPMQVSDPEAARELYDRLAEACRSGGWHVYRSYAQPRGADGSEAPLATRLRHALDHADACVFYVGKPSSGVGAEVAWATEGGRPVIAIQLRDEEPSPLLTGLLAEYDRGALLVCADAEDCAEKVRQTLFDPDWHRILRAAGAELAEELG